MLMSVKGHHSPNSSTFELNDGLFMESNMHIEDILHELISRNLDGFQVFILIEFRLFKFLLRTILLQKFSFYFQDHKWWMIKSFEQKNGLRCMIKACLRRKLKREKFCHWFGAYLCVDLVHIYVPIWCIFMCWFIGITDCERKIERYFHLSFIFVGFVWSSTSWVVFWCLALDLGFSLHWNNLPLCCGFAVYYYEHFFTIFSP